MRLFKRREKAGALPSDAPISTETKIPASEFDALTKPALEHLDTWKTHCVEVSLNHPTPSMEGVLAIEQGTRRMTDDTLNRLRILDERLGLKGQTLGMFVDLELRINAFKANPDGPGFQALGKAVMEAESFLISLREKRAV